MKNLIKRTFAVSEGLSSMTQKKLKSFIGELEKEGVITIKEKQNMVRRIDKIGKSVSDNVVKELKKMLGVANKKAKPVKKTAAKKKKK